MMPYVVDANVMNMFQSERFNGAAGLACSALDEITDNSFIVLDETGHCKDEWISCAGGKPPIALEDWIADMFVRQRLQLATFINDSMYQELNNQGIPKRDHKWVRLARSANANVIVTEDIDLFDPKKKNACTSAAKAKIKSGRKGPVAKYLKKSYKIDVICVEHVSQFIEQPS